jgi:hypothetical protein
MEKDPAAPPDHQNVRKYLYEGSLPAEERRGIVLAMDHMHWSVKGEAMDVRAGGGSSRQGIGIDKFHVALISLHYRHLHAKHNQVSSWSVVERVPLALPKQVSTAGG